MRFAILTLILFFSGCNITTYQHRLSEPIIIEEYHDPVRVVIYPRRYVPPYRYYNYHKPITIRKPAYYHNGIRVHKKNYWSKTTIHPQRKLNKQTERRHNWRHRRKQQSSKAR